MKEVRHVIQGATTGKRLDMNVWQVCDCFGMQPLPGYDHSPRHCGGGFLCATIRLRRRWRV